jgi:hypothetical protein
MPFEAFHCYLQSRRQRGESLASIARSFGVAHVQVSRWLDGTRKPSRTVLLLADHLVRGQISEDAFRR